MNCAHQPQLVGYSGLGHSNLFGDLLNIPFTIHQYVDDADACRVAQSFE